MAENKNKTRAKSNNGKVKKDDGKAFSPNSRIFLLP